MLIFLWRRVDFSSDRSFKVEMECKEDKYLFLAQVKELWRLVVHGTQSSLATLVSSILALWHYHCKDPTSWLKMAGQPSAITSFQPSEGEKF